MDKASVFIYGCNGSVAQQVRIKEIDQDSHDVELRVRDRFCIGVRGKQVTPAGRSNCSCATTRPPSASPSTATRS